MKLAPMLVVICAATVAAMAGIYAVAATTATSMAATFITEESASHTQRVDFEVKARRISAAYKALRVKCDASATAGSFSGAYIPCASSRDIRRAPFHAVAVDSARSP